MRILATSCWQQLVLGILATVLAGCREQPEAASPLSTPWFENFTARSGIDFIHTVEIGGQYLLSESIGSGGACWDFDNDGRLDFYLIHNTGPNTPATNRLFHQQPDGRFKDATAGSGLDITGYGQGVAVGDINNDGLPEILITELDRVRLFLNQGRGKFTDITAAAGVTNQNWAVPAAFFDYDRDGWLDLVIGNYLDFDPSQKCPDARGRPEFCGPHGFRPTLTRLFHNLGAKAPRSSAPRFEDVTISSGLARAPGKAMQILCADFDGDRWPDIFVTDDGLPNRLFVNQRNGTFREEAVARGLAYTGMGAAAANMGVAIGDIDHDGLFDLFVPHLTEENHTLWRQTARGIFQDDTARAGLLSLAQHGTGFAALFADFDCDGAPDLAIANGLVRRRAGHAPERIVAGLAPFWTPYAEPSQVFANDGQGKFHDISPANPALCGEAFVGRGLICGDFDNDGGPDLLLIGIGGPARLCRNIAAPRGHWLGVRTIDPSLGGRDAYGAEVEVTAAGRRWWGLIQPAHGYASSNDPRAHFGLGPLTRTESLLVRWPDGVEESFPGCPADQYVTLRRGTGGTATR